MTTESKINVSDPERAGSVFTGLSLVGYGLKHRGLVRLLVCIAGGLLVYRGVSGRCEGYRLLGINSCPLRKAAAPLIDTKDV